MGGNEDYPTDLAHPGSTQPDPVGETPVPENKVSLDEQEILDALASVKGEGVQDKGMGTAT